MIMLFNAVEARKLSKESNEINLECVLTEIKKAANTGKVNYHLSQEKFTGGLKLKLHELGFYVGGLLTNGDSKTYLISWE